MVVGILECGNGRFGLSLLELVAGFIEWCGRAAAKKQAQKQDGPLERV